MENTLAVVSQSGQSISFFDLTSGERTGHLTDLTAEPHELCFDKLRNILYVSHTYRHGWFGAHGDYSHEISVVDCTTKKCIDIIDVSPTLGPHGLALDPHRDILYASVEELSASQPGGLIAIDLTTRTITRAIDSDSKPHWFVLTPSGTKAYTCNKFQPFISILDLLSGSRNNEKGGNLISKIPIPSCEEPGISPDGKFAYFPTPGLQKFGDSPTDPCIKVIDTSTDTIVKSIPTHLGIQSIHVTPLNTIMVGHYAFSQPKSTPTSTSTSTDATPKAEPGRLSLFSGDSHALLGEAPIGLLPLTMRCSSDGSKGFVANIFGGTVTVVDLSSMEVVRTLDVDTVRREGKTMHQGAHGLALLP